MRRVLLTILLVGSVAAVVTPTKLAGAAQSRTCSSRDLRYPFMPGQPRNFGVFVLTLLGGSCATAHAVAEEWAEDYEFRVKLGDESLPRSAAGFAFTTLPATRSQELRELGRRGAITIRFNYRIPSG